MENVIFFDWFSDGEAKWGATHVRAGCLSVSVGCCQVEVSATSLSLVQRNPADCGASLCVI